MDPGNRGAGASGLPSAFSLGTRRARFIEGQLGPVCTSEIHGGLGEYRDVPAMLIRWSSLSSCTAGGSLPVPLCGTPGQVSLPQAPPPLPLWDGDTGCCPAGVSGDSRERAGLPPPSALAPFLRVPVGTSEVRAYF